MRSFSPRKACVFSFWSVLVAFSAAAANSASQEHLTPRQLYIKCAPSVVMVTATETVPYGLANRTIDLLNPFPVVHLPGDLAKFVFYPFQLLVAGPVKAGGSGVIIDKEGHFITNHHVIARANVFWATLHDRRVVRAKLVGSDEMEDYALLKLELGEGEEVAPAALGDSAGLRPGDRVAAIGSPLRLRETLSTGVVAGLERRSFGPFQDFIQTDLTIGAGSSGGPLFNARGEVIGITAMMHAVLEQTGGVTFSIPINSVREGLDRLRKEGEVTRGFIGAHIKDVTPQLVEELELTATSGACVVEVGTPLWRYSPAADAGLRRGDVIVKYGGLEIERARPLARAVLNTKPGKKVTVEFRRGKSVLSRTLHIVER